MYPERFQRIHAKKRLSDRFGLVINRIAYKDLIARIQHPNRPSGRVAWHVVQNWKNQDRSLWLVRYNDSVLPVIYDRATECVVTVLPKEVMRFIDQRILEKAGYLES